MEEPVKIVADGLKHDEDQKAIKALDLWLMAEYAFRKQRFLNVKTIPVAAIPLGQTQLKPLLQEGKTPRLMPGPRLSVLALMGQSQIDFKSLLKRPRGKQS